MYNLLDNEFFEADRPIKPVYGTFWERLIAYLLDALIVSAVGMPIAYFNVTSWKSFAILIVATSIGIAYKPFMEYHYGATIGKMAQTVIIKR